MWWKGNANYPCHFNPTTVVVQPLRRAGSVSAEPVDADFQEPTGPYERNDDTITLRGQPFFERYEKHMTVFGGDTKPVVGRVVFKTTELNKKLKTAGLTELRNGDLIIQIGSQTVEYLIIETRPVGWMGGGPISDSEPSLTAAFFMNNIEDIAGSRAIR